MSAAPADARPPAAAGPRQLVLVRHGESLGNVADRQARELGHARLALDVRDADVELSEVGERQAAAVGSYLRSLDAGQRPTAVITSPYRRARATAERVLEQAGLDLPLSTDERLRERDLGSLDGLTGAGIRAEFPAEAERRARIGKLYYRPPGGESWCDVTLRVRVLLDSLRLSHDGQRVWVFSHQAVIMSFRMALEGLAEAELMGIDRDTPLPNCSLTTYQQDGSGTLRLQAFADTTAVDAAPVPVTHEPESAGQHGAR